MQNPVCRVVLVASRQALDLIDRPVIQLFNNHKPSFLPSVLNLTLAHKPVSSYHDNVSGLQSNSCSFAVVIALLFDSFL